MSLSFLWNQVSRGIEREKIPNLLDLMDTAGHVDEIFNPYWCSAGEVILFTWDSGRKEGEPEDKVIQLFDDYLFGLFFGARNVFSESYDLGMTPKRWKDRYFQHLQTMWPKKEFIGQIGDVSCFLIQEDDLKMLRVEATNGSSKQLRFFNRAFWKVSFQKVKTTKKILKLYDSALDSKEFEKESLVVDVYGSFSRKHFFSNPEFTITVSLPKEGGLYADL